jgi:hypothetical protein
MAVEVGIGGVEQLRRPLLLLGEFGGSPGEPGSIPGRDPLHERIDMTQSGTRQDNRELVATGPEHRIGGADTAADRVHQGSKGSVALGMTQ